MTRRYELRRRAEQVAATRRRIVAATLQLHEEVGPAATTISAIAERAGVSRPTVYSQFPDDRSLFTACSAHFRDRHPLPRKLEAADLRTALQALYAHYAANRAVLAHVDRDARALPALAEVMRSMGEHYDQLAERHASGRASRRAIVRLALEFRTWERLDADGLSPRRAATLMARLADCAGSARFRDGATRATPGCHP